MAPQPTPFIPFEVIRFVVLKIRKASGVEMLSLRHAERGSFGVPREWTDWAPPGTPSESINGQQPLLFNAVGALALRRTHRKLVRRHDKLGGDPACERLMTVPGIAPIISTATVATQDRPLDWPRTATHSETPCFVSHETGPLAGFRPVA
jgi:hypothetical protein